MHLQFGNKTKMVQKKKKRNEMKTVSPSHFINLTMLFVSENKAPRAGVYPLLPLQAMFATGSGAIIHSSLSRDRPNIRGDSPALDYYGFRGGGVDALNPTCNSTLPFMLL